MQLFELQAELLISFMNAIFTWKYKRETNYGYSDLGIWETSWKWIKSITASIFFASGKIQAFKWKSEFWKTCIHLHELASFLIFKDFSNEFGGITNKRHFLILYDEIREHLKDLYNSVNQYFPSYQYLMLQNDT